MQLFTNKREIIVFTSGLVLGVVFSVALVWGVNGFLFSSQPKALGLTQEEIQIKKNLLQQQNVAVHAPVGPNVASGQQPPMPWDVASNMIQHAPVEKIETTSGLLLKLHLKGGMIFTTQQPTKDAYVSLLKKTVSKIEIVK